MYRYHPGYSSPGTPRVSDYYGHVGLLSRTLTTIAGLVVSVFTLSFSSNCIILLLYYSPIRRLTAKAGHNAFGEVTHTLHGHKRKRYTPSRVHGHKKPKPSNFVTKVQGEKSFWALFFGFISCLFLTGFRRPPWFLTRRFSPPEDLLPVALVPRSCQEQDRAHCFGTKARC